MDLERTVGVLPSKEKGKSKEAKGQCESSPRIVEELGPLGWFSLTGLRFT